MTRWQRWFYAILNDRRNVLPVVMGWLRQEVMVDIYMYTYIPIQLMYFMCARVGVRRKQKGEETDNMINYKKKFKTWAVLIELSSGNEYE